MQTRRHGQWQTDSCDGAYAAALARGPMRALAGFPSTGREYFLPRAALEPPSEITAQIFPECDSLLLKVKTNDGCDVNMAAIGFLELLIFLRKVIIEDAALLCSTGNFEIFQHSIFKSSAFMLFKNQLHESIGSAENPRTTRLANILPDLSQELRAQHASLSQQISIGFESLQATSSQTNGFVSDLVSGRAEIRTVSTSTFCIPAVPLQTNLPGEQKETPKNRQEPSVQNVVSFSMSRGVETIKDL